MRDFMFVFQEKMIANPKTMKEMEQFGQLKADAEKRITEYFKSYDLLAAKTGSVDSKASKKRMNELFSNVEKSLDNLSKFVRKEKSKIENEENGALNKTEFDYCVKQFDDLVEKFRTSAKGSAVAPVGTLANSIIDRTYRQ